MRSRKGRPLVETLESRKLLSHPIFDLVSYSNSYSPVAPNSISFSTADFNGDGKADTASGNSYGVNVSLSNGDGTFTTTFHNFGTRCIVTAADVNGDGKPDLALIFGATPPTVTDTFLRVMLNNGEGTFTSLADRHIGSGVPASIAAGDFDADGKVDLAIAREVGSSPGIATALLGAGDGTFAEGAVDFPTRPRPSKVMSADFSGDGKGDLVVLSSDSRSARVFISTGDGSFTPAMEHLPNSFTSDIAVADFNGDGRPDLAVSASRSVRLLLNNGDGTFSTSVSYTLNSEVHAYYTRIISADFNGDGAVDLASGSMAGLYGNDFTLVLNDGTGVFGPPVEQPYGPGGYAAMAAADFNGDGRVDLRWSGGSSGVLLNAGNAGFAVRTDYLGASTRPSAVFAGRINDDDLIDLVLNSSTVSARVFLNNGDGTFSAGRHVGSPGTVSAMLDLNGDGRTDLVVTGSGTAGLRINNGDGTFGPLVQPSDLFAPTIDFNGDGKPDILFISDDGIVLLAMASPYDGIFGDPAIHRAADLNGDGLPEIVMKSGSNVRIRLDNGDGTYAAGVDYAAGTGTLTIADFNGDGMPDIAVGATVTGSGLSVLMNQGNGTFSAAVQYAHAISSIVAADFNGDGKPDLAGTDYYGQSLRVLLNQGNGTFSPPLLYATGGGPMGLAAADINGDGKPDLAWANFWSNSMSVMLNVSPPPLVQSARFDHAGPRPQLRFQISGDVWQTLSTAHVVVTTVPGGAPVSVLSYSHDPATHAAIFTLPTSTPDGNYRATLLAAGVQDLNGTPLAGDFSFDFFVFAGDANRDRTVDARDLFIVANNWLGTGRTFDQGDFNYDGIVDKADLTILTQRWQQKLEEPPPQEEAAAATGARRPGVRTPVRVAIQILA